MGITTIFFMALIAAETPNCACLDQASFCFCIGDSGASWGAYQIQNIYVRDINRIYGTSYVHEDALDTVKATRMVGMYVSHYGTRARIGREVILSDLASIHNNGPGGWSDPETFAHWYRFWVELERMKNE